MAEGTERDGRRPDEPAPEQADASLRGFGGRAAPTHDAMGNDKRRQVIGGQYGATVRKRLIVYGVAIAVIIGARDRLPDRRHERRQQGDPARGHRALDRRQRRPGAAARHRLQPQRPRATRSRTRTSSTASGRPRSAAPRRPAVRVASPDRPRSTAPGSASAGTPPRHRLPGASTARRRASRRLVDEARAPACRPGCSIRLSRRSAVDRVHLVGTAGRRAEQPDDDGDVADQVEDGAEAVRVGDRPPRSPRPRSPRRRLASARSRARSSPRRAARGRARARGSRSRRAAPEPRSCGPYSSRRGRARAARRSMLGERLLVHPAALAHPLVLARHPLGVRLGQLLGAALAPVVVLGGDHLLRRRPPRAGTRSRSRGSASSRAGRRRCPGRSGR